MSISSWVVLLVLLTQLGWALADKPGMTLPRIRPYRADEHGKPTTRSTFLVTRTTSDRRFLLKPGGTVNDVFAFCLFADAAKCDAEIHGSLVPSKGMTLTTDSQSH